MPDVRVLDLSSLSTRLGEVPERPIGPVSKTSAAVARFGRIDRRIGEPPCARRCHPGQQYEAIRA